MLYSHIFRMAPVQGDKDTIKNADTIEKEHQINDICLNCTKSKCIGECTRFNEEKRRVNSEHSQHKEKKGGK